MVPYFNFEIIELQSMSVHMQYPSLFHAYHILCLTAFFNTSRQLPPYCVLSDIEFAIYASKECWCNWFLTFLYIWAKLVFVLHMHSIFFYRKVIYFESRLIYQMVLVLLLSDISKQKNSSKNTLWWNMKTSVSLYLLFLYMTYVVTQNKHLLELTMIYF